MSETNTKKQSSWVKALKQFNTGRDKYLIPKKDTPEHEVVTKIMNDLKAKQSVDVPVENLEVSVKGKSKRIKKTKPVVEEIVIEEVPVVVEKQKKTKKVKPVIE